MSYGMFSNILCGPLYCNQPLAVTNKTKKIRTEFVNYSPLRFAVRATITFLKIFRNQVSSPFIMTLHLNQENIPPTGC
jgi:hypothetical protein